MSDTVEIIVVFTLGYLIVARHRFWPPLLRWLKARQRKLSAHRRDKARIKELEERIKSYEEDPLKDFDVRLRKAQNERLRIAAQKHDPEIEREAEAEAESLPVAGTRKKPPARIPPPPPRGEPRQS